MPKMPYTGENHSQAMLISCDNRLLITDRSTRLDDSFDASGCDFFDIVRKGEESVLAYKKMEFVNFYDSFFCYICDG